MNKTGKDADMIHSLFQPVEYPLDISQPLCHEYALLKLGVASSVQHFAVLLMPKVQAILENNPRYTSWVLTAPPSRHLPTAAILLSLKIYEMLQLQYPEEGQIRITHLYNHRDESSLHEAAKDFNNFSGYSAHSWDKRMALIRQNRFHVQPEDFYNRGILFINDINVTGASQEHISQVFSAVYPDKLHWLYIIDCDKEMGRKNPQLENELNNTGINTVQDFAAVLAVREMRHTAKCISKIFGYNNVELEQLLGILNPVQKSQILDAIRMENMFQGDVFKEKMDLLQGLCRKHKN